MFEQTWSERMRAELAHVPVLSLDEMRVLPASDDNVPAIYFLWLNDELQYIGKSRQVQERITRLFRDWRYRLPRGMRHDRNTVLLLDREPEVTLDQRLQDRERIYIATYETPHNVANGDART